jgi:hypothetical protein
MKLERAKQRMQELEEALKSFYETKPHRFSGKPDLQARRVVYTMDFVADVPDAIPLIAGDMIQNLRSALDHLAYQLFLRGTRPAGAEKDIYFPIGKSKVASGQCLDPRRFDRTFDLLQQRLRLLTLWNRLTRFLNLTPAAWADRNTSARRKWYRETLSGRSVTAIKTDPCRFVQHHTSAKQSNANHLLPEDFVRFRHIVGDRFQTNRTVFPDYQPFFNESASMRLDAISGDLGPRDKSKCGRWSRPLKSLSRF